VILVCVCVRVCICVYVYARPVRTSSRHVSSAPCLSVGSYMSTVLFFPLVSRVPSWGACPDGCLGVCGRCEGAVCVLLVSFVSYVFVCGQ
jgi:hypothetical protein